MTPAVKIVSQEIHGVFLVSLIAHGDNRGRITEFYRREWFGPGGREMVQVNCTERHASVIVGLHWHRHQADYWTVIRGQARVVLHDLRVGSPSDKSTLVYDVDGNVYCGIYIPPGVAHGFVARTDTTLVYLNDRYYDVEDEHGLAWDDPAVDAVWGVTRPILSERDRQNPKRVDIRDLPLFDCSQPVRANKPCGG